MTSAGTHVAPHPLRAAWRTRWPRRRILSWSAKLGATLVASLALTGFAAAHKTVTLSVDGESWQVASFSGSVGAVLTSQGVAVEDRDLVVPALTAEVPRGGEILVRHAQPLNLSIDGQARTIWTTAPTVEEALADLGVRATEAQLSVARSAAIERLDGVVSVSTAKQMVVAVDGTTLRARTNAATVGQTLTALGVVLGPDDQVTPALTAVATPGQTIKVERAYVTNGSQTLALEFQQIQQDDPNMLKGTTKVLQAGVAGERVITYVATIAGEDELDRYVVMDSITRAPVDEIVAVGTKEPPKPPPAAAAGSAPRVNTNVDPGSNQGIARQMMADSYGWGDDQFSCLVPLWQAESKWSHTAHNSYSGAHGIPQALPGSKMASAGADWQSNPATQIAWGLGYISGRYGTPCGAWGAFQSKGWY